METTLDSNTSVSEFSHVIAAETEYYTTGPQQGRPPDGKFPAGTKVSIVEDAGSYVRVWSDGGIERVTCETMQSFRRSIDTRSDHANPDYHLDDCGQFQCG